MSSSQQARAVVLEAFGAPVRSRELPVAEPGPGAIVATVELAGVCGTDVHLQAGRLPIPLPVVLGHEGVGRIAALGEGVTEDSLGTPLAAGDLVAWGSSISCGDCFYCRDAQEPTLCERRRIYGINRRADEWPHLGGAWAEAIYLHPGSMVVRLGAGTPPEAVIALGCAGPTAVHGLLGVAPVGVGESVVVQGVGPVGLATAMYAQLAGAANVVLIGGPASRLERARALGVGDAYLELDAQSPAERLDAVRELTGGRGGDLVVEATGVPAAVAEGLELCRPGGRYLVLGQYTDHGPTPLNPHLVTRKQLRVLGSWAFSQADYATYLRTVPQLAARFDLPRLLERFTLGDAQAALDAARAGEVGKAVLVPDAG